MQPIISIVGRSGVGKTTLIEKLISEFLKKGYRVAAIKHGAHDFEIDHEGKDTWRYAKAGACNVIISSSQKMALIKRRDEEISLSKLCDLYLDDVDIVIAEGYKKEKIPKIEVHRKARQKHLLCEKKDRLVAVASDTQHDIDLPVFDVNDAGSICEFIIKRVVPKKRESSGVALRVNDRKIPLNHFVKEMFKQVLMGMISTLKIRGLNTPKKLELIVDLEEATKIDDSAKSPFPPK
ncbi:MAG: molybdopterin-guanine dinucleotide biosynthesis protein B [Deltaproteobacteria bacterium]|nr:molybdopterin-guanine dinucleotide biosynthesis protein B [Deltaproteobacteria bacterium]